MTRRTRAALVAAAITGALWALGAQYSGESLRECVQRVESFDQSACI